MFVCLWGKKDTYLKSPLAPAVSAGFWEHECLWSALTRWVFFSQTWYVTIEVCKFCGVWFDGLNPFNLHCCNQKIKKIHTNMSFPLLLSPTPNLCSKDLSPLLLSFNPHCLLFLWLMFLVGSVVRSLAALLRLTIGRLIIWTTSLKCLHISVYKVLMKSAKQKHLLGCFWATAVYHRVLFSSLRSSILSPVYFIKYLFQLFWKRICTFFCTSDGRMER